jgi:ABC-2 type transport system permease protein
MSLLQPALKWRCEPAMNMAYIIARRELASLLKSPLAWIIAATVQAILAYIFIIDLDYYVSIQGRLAASETAPGMTELVVTPLLIATSWVFLVISPLLTMRLFSDELKQNSLALLYSSPLAMWHIVLGKYIAVAVYLLLLTALTLLMPLSLLLGGHLDLGMMFSGVLGLLLVSFSYIALGLFINCLTKSAMVTAVTSTGILLMLWLIELSIKTGESGAFINYISMLHHFIPLMKGIFSTTDLVYYLLFTVFFLVLSVKQLDYARVQA